LMPARTGRVHSDAAGVVKAARVVINRNMVLIGVLWLQVEIRR
jgi:hypothetical protein